MAHVTPALLLAAADRLSGRDRATALDMSERGSRYGWTVKQAAFAGVLYRRATGERAAQVPGLCLGSPSAVRALLATARANTPADGRRPCLRLSAGGQRLKVYEAGQRAREPGSLVVVLPDEQVENRFQPGQQQARRVGVVGLDGSFAPAFGMSQWPHLGACTAVLRNLLANPMGTAKAYASKVGRCVFCGRRLEGNDGRSLLVGYGEDCAAKYGLPWGERGPTEVEVPLQPAQEPAQAPASPEPLDPAPALAPELERHAASWQAPRYQPPVFAGLDDPLDDLDVVLNSTAA